MQKNKIAVYGNNNSYLSEYQGILDDFKEIHKLMAEAEGPEVFYLLTGAQKKLTAKTVEEVDRIIKDLVINFTDENIEKFMEKIISILSSLETTKQLYGNIIDVDSVKKYISKKVTVLTIKRYKIIEGQIIKNRFIEEAKLKVLYSNITNCKKVIVFAIDLDSKNIKAMEFMITMLKNLIDNSTRMGVDNYTREVIQLEISEYESMRDFIINFDGSHQEDEIGLQGKSENNLVNEKAVEESCNMLVALNNSTDSKADQILKLTNQFINTANDVVENAKIKCAGGPYINESVKQFASLMSTVQTLNYLQNGVVDVVAVSKVISNILLNIAWEHYTDLLERWNVISIISSEDIKIFIRETSLYLDILTKSYDIYPDNIKPLKKYIDILDKKIILKKDLKLSKDDELNINRDRKTKAEIIKRKDPGYKLLELDFKKKKGFFSMLWGK